MCAYDTTLIETLHSQDSTEADDPECLRRNLLDSKYFPAIGRATLATVIALCVVYSLTSFNRLNHTDLWGHVNFGRWIVEHGALPAADPFAAETRPAPFLNVPWLAQVIGYLTQRFLGNEGLILGHALIVTCACGVMMFAVRRRGVSACGAIAAGATLYLLSLPIVGTIRPQLFGMLGAALVLAAGSLLPSKRHPVFWLPVVFLLWANLHGSFVIGIAMLGLIVLGASWNIWRETTVFTKTLADRRFQWLWLTLAACVAAACVNPLGPPLLVKVLQFGGNSSLAYISEWRSLTPFSLSGVLFFASIAAAGLLMRCSDRKLEVQDVLLLGFFAMATISSMRMLAWWALVWSWAIPPLADSVWRKRFAVGSRRPEDEPSSMRTAIAMGFVFMCLLLAPPSQSLVSGRQRGVDGTTSSDTPIFVAERLAEQRMSGRIFAPLDWADYLVWRNGDRIKPLIYSHVHLVHPETFYEYQRIAAADPAWLQLAQENRLKYLVISRNRNAALLHQVLLARNAADPPIRVVYQDQQAVIAELLDRS
jgi:hypothetical protein